jgi:hypothetical protein
MKYTDTAPVARGVGAGRGLSVYFIYPMYYNEDNS